MSSGVETNKIAGAVLTALLVTVGIGHFGAALFGGGHGEAELAYPVAAGPVETIPDEPEIIPSVLPLLADASVADGESLFASCRGCHTVDEGGANGVGPNLWLSVGADIGSHDGYSYSEALAGLEGDWTYDALNEFLYKPAEYAPGTKMGFAGLPNVQDRANMIAYLRTLNGDPMPLPTAEEIEAAMEEPEAEGGDGAAENGEPVDVPEDAAEAVMEDVMEEVMAEGLPTVSPLLADASAANGESLFATCRACHTPDEGGANGVGPNLWNVVGRDIGSHEGYSYSDAVAGLDGIWDYETLSAFLAAPLDYAPGTKMGFLGLPEVEDRADLIAYLRSLSSDPMPLPDGDATATEN